MPPEPAGLAVPVDPRRREYPLPGPLPPAVGILALKGGRELDPARAPGHIVLMLPAGGRRGGSARSALIMARSMSRCPCRRCRAPGQLAGCEVHVLGAEMAALQDGETRAVEKAGHQPGGAGEPLSTARTLSRMSTTGSRTGRLARTTSSSHGRSISRTSR